MKSTRILSLGRHGTTTSRFGFYITGCRFNFETISIIAPALPKFVIDERRFWSASRVRSRLPQPVLLFGQYPNETARSSDRLHASRYCLGDEEGEQPTLLDVPAESEICRDRCGEMGEALRRSVFTEWRRAGGPQTGPTEQNAVFASRSCGQGNGHFRTS